MLPIVQRELRVGARDPKLYKGRLRIGVVIIICAALLLVSNSPGRFGGGPGGFFWGLTWLAFLFCLLEGVRKTSDAISEERREGTLGFLFLTDLRGYDVALGKWAGAFIRSFSGLLAFIPILAVTLLLGGTTAGEFWRSVLVLILALALSLSVCLAVSTMRKERSAGLCMTLLAMLCTAPSIAAEILRAVRSPVDPRLVEVISPAALLNAGTDAATFMTSRPFWIGAAYQCGIIFFALVLASLVTPRVWQDRPSRRAIKPRSQGSEQARRTRRGKLLDRNPILWLAFSERQHRLFTILFMSLASIFAAGCAIALIEISNRSEAAVALGFSAFVLSLLLMVQLASQASTNLAEARRNGTLELLLSTPLKVRDIVRGQWLALRRTFAPALVVIAGFVACFWLLALDSPTPASLFWIGKSTLELAIEFLLLGWVGMWSGLVSKSPNRAFFRTLGLGLFLPFFFCTPTLLNQVVLLAVASDQVQVNFRRFVAEKYLQNPKFVLPPALAGTNVPPVIR